MCQVLCSCAHDSANSSVLSDTPGRMRGQLQTPGCVSTLKHSSLCMPQSSVPSQQNCLSPDKLQFTFGQRPLTTSVSAVVLCSLFTICDVLVVVFHSVYGIVPLLLETKLPTIHHDLSQSLLQSKCPQVPSSGWGQDCTGCYSLTMKLHFRQTVGWGQAHRTLHIQTNRGVSQMFV